MAVTHACTFEVGVHRYSAGAVDRLGVAASVYTPAKDQPGGCYLVYGPVPVSSTEHESLVIVEQELLVPPDFPATADGHRTTRGLLPWPVRVPARSGGPPQESHLVILAGYSHEEEMIFHVSSTAPTLRLKNGFDLHKRGARYWD